MYDTIVYPTDGSDGAEAAREHVENLASLCDATVDVLHVVNTTEGHGMVGGHLRESEPGMVGDHTETDRAGMVGGQQLPEDVRESLREDAESLVEDVAGRFDGVETRSSVLFGDPQQMIRSHADEVDADFVVMGTHGRTGLDRYLIGSVTEKVVRLSDVPVVTVRQDGDAERHED